MASLLVRHPSLVHSLILILVVLGFSGHVVGDVACTSPTLTAVVQCHLDDGADEGQPSGTPCASCHWSAELPFRLVVVTDSPFRFALVVNPALARMLALPPPFLPPR